MTSTHNILLDPLPEIRAALSSNSFGVSGSKVIEEKSFPRTEEELISVKDETRSTGITPSRVVGRAEIVLKDEEGIVSLRLDRSGWTIDSAEGSNELSQKVNKTYESLETLLIDISESYVQAMNQEIWKRFGMEKENSEVEEEDNAERSI
ncbi:uncharacterized protein IL334_004885 [Kwoniella shivajii]|uniref:GSKIP domain-containing protein n=1 Tax=Kwoniella shivajii TaxID=564305 RepID=A0ABZ1D4L4_9TREE|nr:hypothetical protein IL334_004885 [Kwoniella shivajii]